MKIRAKLDDAESRAYWDSVRRGARAYDELPAWKKGVLGEVDPVAGDGVVDSGDDDARESDVD